MSDATINVADLYTRLGSMERAAIERENQTSEIFKVLRDIQKNMATKEDVAAVNRTLHGDPDIPSTGHGLIGRVEQLEADKAAVKRTVVVAAGTPAFVAALIEIGRFMVGKH